MSSFQNFTLDEGPFIKPSQKLHIELVPRTSWGNNLRSRLDPKDWDRLRKQQSRRAGAHCEICGESGRQQGYRHPVECHEVWAYDDSAHMQKLERLISLCPRCHKVKHFGRTLNVDGPDAADDAMLRIQRINGWSEEQVEAHIQEAFELWETRSQHTWDLDLTFLSEADITISPA